jgi:SAM-dependent methyltransferase
MTGEAVFKEFGSFRDPSGSVFYFAGAVYRGVDADTFDRVQRLIASGLFRELVQAGLVVDTGLVPPGSAVAGKLGTAFGPDAHFLKHATIPFVSYPYEWTAGMLADAGILHLDLQLKLLAKGFSLKDATAFNVAFAGSRPVFMDIPSIEVPKQMNVWVAYGQFCRMFVYPLLLHRDRGMDFRQCFLGNLDGPSVAATRRLLGLRRSLSSKAFVDVFLQHVLCGAAEKRIQSSKSIGLNRGGPEGDSRAQELNLMRLRRLLVKLSQFLGGHSDWAAYEQTKTYTDADEAVKSRFMERFLREHTPASVLDMGCNTGRYAWMALESGARVVAMDADHDCVEALYQRVRGSQRDLLPLCMDITNPSPALGFRHAERKCFEARGPFDAVFALALIHHLLVSARIPLPALCGLFAAMTQTWLIIEFVHPDDAMFQRLLATREHLYKDLSAERFEAAFGRSFEIVQRQELMGGRRVLYLMRKMTFCG